VSTMINHDELVMDFDTRREHFISSVRFRSYRSGLNSRSNDSWPSTRIMCTVFSIIVSKQGMSKDQLTNENLGYVIKS
jgi:hypothetical protein